MFILGLMLACFIAACIVVGLLYGKSDGKGGPQGDDH